MKNKTQYIILGIIVFIFTISVMTLNNNLNENAVKSSGVVLSNKKIGWGIKREKDHKTPDLGAENLKLLEQYNGVGIGDINSNKVYLTFDEGYEAGYTEQILNTLKVNNVQATFFITAHYVNSQPELVRKMIDEGHIIGNHTVNHKSMPDLTDEKIKKEIMDLHTSVYEKFGYEMKYIRPPMGEFSERTLEIINKLGYKTVMWSLAYDDWDENKQGREEYAEEKILENIHNGAIILLHGNSKDNANVLDNCIKEIRNMGYEFGSLNELWYEIVKQ